MKPISRVFFFPIRVIAEESVSTTYGRKIGTSSTSPTPTTVTTTTIPMITPILWTLDSYIEYDATGAVHSPTAYPICHSKGRSINSSTKKRPSGRQ